MEITMEHSFVLTMPGLPSEATALTMIWLSPGTFLMGSPPDEPDRIKEEEQQFEATLGRGFWLGKYPVTQAQWQVVMGTNPSYFQQISINCPVENVNWHDAMAFCKRLNQLFPAYLPAEYGFSLPTEMQWEYACRAGTSMKYNTGATLVDLDRAAWHQGNSSGHTHSVGKKEPNVWGLYDMHGNTFEWCFDPTSGYPDGSATDWVGDGNGYVRSNRSSSWVTPWESTDHRCACRGYVSPDEKRSWFGFRLCLRTVRC